MNDTSFVIPFLDCFWDEFDVPDVRKSYAGLSEALTGTKTAKNKKNGNIEKMNFHNSSFPNFHSDIVEISTISTFSTIGFQRGKKGMDCRL